MRSALTPYFALQAMDEFVHEFGEPADGRNLGPHFDFWGIPTSKAARDEVAGLPEWKR